MNKLYLNNLYIYHDHMNLNEYIYYLNHELRTYR